jgi:hypothetical protein
MIGTECEQQLGTSPSAVTPRSQSAQAPGRDVDIV